MAAAVARSAPMQTLLFSSPPCAALQQALIELDQMTLMVHDKFNSRFPSARPAKAQRKTGQCSLCKGHIGWVFWGVG